VPRGRELQKRPVRTPDPADEPSAEWGWHGRLPMGARIGGVFVVITLFGMLIGNQQGHVEDWFLVFTGVLFIGLLLWGGRRNRGPWRH
jgi:hypothetical protein